MMEEENNPHKDRSPSYRTRKGTILSQLRLIYRIDEVIEEIFNAPCTLFPGQISLRDVCENDADHEACAAGNSYFLHDLFVLLHSEPGRVVDIFGVETAEIHPLR